eukprot:1098335-Prorocentrum_minimum.AAC.1
MSPGSAGTNRGGRTGIYLAQEPIAGGERGIYLAQEPIAGSHRFRSGTGCRTRSHGAQGLQEPIVAAEQGIYLAQEPIAGGERGIYQCASEG